MLTVVKRFFDVAVLRGNPQDLPASNALLAATMLVDMVTAYALASRSLLGVRPVAVVGHTFLMALLVYILLRWRGYPARFQQTATALFGSGIIATVVAFAAIHLAGVPFDLTNHKLMMILWLISLWVLAIIAHVLRHALEVSLGMAILITLGVGFVRSLLMLALPLN